MHFAQVFMADLTHFYSMDFEWFNWFSVIIFAVCVVVVVCVFFAMSKHYYQLHRMQFILELWRTPCVGISWPLCNFHKLLAFANQTIQKSNEMRPRKYDTQLEWEITIDCQKSFSIIIFNAKFVRIMTQTRNYANLAM